MATKVVGANPAAAGGATKPTTFPTDIDCDVCGKHMVARKGRRGYFLGCSGYPKCKNTGEVPAALVEQLGLDAGAKPVEAQPAAEEDDDEIPTDIGVD